MSSPALQYAKDETQASLARVLHRCLNEVKSAFEIDSKIPWLRHMLEECLNSPALTYTTAFEAYESAILNEIEQALNNVAESFQRDLSTQPCEDLHTVNAARLCESARGLVEDWRVEVAAEELRQLLTMDEDDTNGLTVVLDMLMKHSQRVSLPLEDPPEDPPEVYRAWFFEFALCLLVEISQMVSVRFAGWEVSFMGQVVPGTGVRARCLRPRIAGPGSASQAAATAIEDPVQEPPKAGQAKHGRFHMLRRRAMSGFKKLRKWMRGKIFGS